MGYADSISLQAGMADEQRCINYDMRERMAARAWNAALQTIREQLTEPEQLAQLLNTIDATLVDQPRYDVTGKDCAIGETLLDCIEKLETLGVVA